MRDLGHGVAVKRLLVSLLVLGCCAAGLPETVFQDDFKGKLGEGWRWIRERPGAWRTTERGLEVRVEPGNMWGRQDDARNLLVRPAPETGAGELEIAVTVENKPTLQYEQADLVYYWNQSNQVKLGQEFANGKVNVVMGREEHGQAQTVASVPFQSATVRLCLQIRGTTIRGLFREPAAREWRVAGQCELPAPDDAKPNISLQFYQGSQAAEHWARVSDFRITRSP